MEKNKVLDCLIREFNISNDEKYKTRIICDASIINKLIYLAEENNKFRQDLMNMYSATSLALSDGVIESEKVIKWIESILG